MSSFNDDVFANDDLPVAKRQQAPQQGKLKLPLNNRSLMLAGGGGGLLLVMTLLGGALIGAMSGSSSPDPDVADGSPSTTDVISDEVNPDDPSVIATAPSTTEETGPEVILGHYSYEEAPPDDLEVVGNYNGRSEQLRTEAARQFVAMQSAAQQEGVGLVAISGYRSIETQEYLFFQLAQSRAMGPQERALVSAPPGFSEHHTGYAIDIGDRRQPQTHIETSFERTQAFSWLQTNAARYGFEMSFPPGNSQGVSYEPWHWRYVGNSDSLRIFYANRPRTNNSEAE